MMRQGNLNSVKLAFINNFAKQDGLNPDLIPG
jgi:hypothetical protein